MVRRRFKHVRRLGCLILIAGLCIAAYFALDFFRGWTGEGPTEKDRTVVIAEGSTLTAAASEMEEDGAITSARAFLLRAKIFGSDSPIKAGDLQFHSHTHKRQKLNIIKTGHQSRKKQKR